ncbi:heat-inducible transcriptional repressor HrcA [Arcanobacterium hippocoleae]|uniref:Heat-inducible transcription repressor HrcA n=1 Tax=Arcanobacterium hippocoleae TaxID=149017 RepID=A0ABU1T0U1_9ACTO|nr:heat-inducible transcriptional repressor HrcA [Arcanobacterium hippocoleae]MDR6938921.1 heat-inducible transcriptional repressor [Arcanobacterium hippocoleae]
MANPQARRAAVLHAIVEDYVTTREPVGSRSIVERYHLGVSSATVRNDMAQLEEAGLIIQPHTSAGRIPTDAGYRAFVDSLAEIKPLSRGERNAFEKYLRDGVDLDDVLSRAVRLLAQITNQVAVVQYPSLRKSMLRHIEIVSITDTTALLVLISNSGRVEQRIFEVNSGLNDDDFSRLRKTCNAHFCEKPLAQLQESYPQALQNLPHQYQHLLERIFDTIIGTLGAQNEERVVVAGTGNLSRYDVDFASSISPVLDALEEQVVLLQLLAAREAGMKVQIGRENAQTALAETAVVSTGYGNGYDQQVARLGVIGPTRMDYAAAMSSVYAISQYLTEILKG